MLGFRLNGDILEVVETSFGNPNAKVTYWYYDTKFWMKNANGKKYEKVSLKMDDASIEWVKKYYLPEVL